MIAAEIERYEQTVAEYLRGDLDEDTFRVFRLNNGIYGQRQPGVQMFRIKIPFGGLTANQLRRIAELADTYATGVGHVTTRQDIQLHFVQLKDVGTMMRKLAEVGLTTREAADGAIALLDGWATIGDVLTFYQERIANEGFLQTATERRSVVELARLVGYRPRPGVAASVYLAYTIDEGFTEEALVPAGSRAQSIPGPGETAESFETAEDLRARATWNDLRPRMTAPQTEAGIRCGDRQWADVYLAGTATNLKPNDPLLIDFGAGRPEFFRVRAVAADSTRTRPTSSCGLGSDS